MATLTASSTPLARARTYASFVRFEHTLFSLPLILAGVFSVPGPALPAARWALIALAAVGARTAALALNRLIDRRLDALNPRTRSRELPSGAMKGAEAWVLLAVSTLVYVAACAALGPWYLKVAVIPLVVFAGYPWLKRFTPLCHFGVGLALALAPLAGYAAAHPDLTHPAPALWLAAFALFWVSGFDIIYATLDEESDRANGIWSMVAWLGRKNALRVSAWLHRASIVCLALTLVAMVGLWFPRPLRYVRGFIAAVLWSVPARILYLEQKWAEDVDLAFFRANVWVGAAVLVATLATRALNGGF